MGRSADGGTVRVRTGPRCALLALLLLSAAASARDAVRAAEVLHVCVIVPHVPVRGGPSCPPASPPTRHPPLGAQVEGDPPPPPRALHSTFSHPIHHSDASAPLARRATADPSVVVDGALGSPAGVPTSVLGPSSALLATLRVQFAGTAPFSQVLVAQCVTQASAVLSVSPGWVSWDR